MVYAYKSFWIYAIKFIYNVGRNNFSLPIYLSWNIDVDLCPDFKSPNMQIYFFSLLCLLLAVRDTKHSPRDVQMDTGNETRLSWLQWSLLNFWSLNYCRPCLSYLLLSFLGGLRLHIWVFRFFFIIQDVSVSQPVLCFEDWCFKPTLHGTASMESSRDRSFPGWGEFLSMEPSSVHCTLSESSAPWPLPNPCEYCHQPYNYPQVLLSRNHLLVVFYISLQHRVLRKTC